MHWHGPLGVHVQLLLSFLAPSSPPLDLTVSDLMSRSLHLSWAPPLPETANGIIRRYLVNVTEMDSGDAALITVSFNSTLQIYTLHPHTSYLVSVSAFTVSEGPYAVLEVETPQDGQFIRIATYVRTYI